jgi:hypothetical protein
MLAKVTGTLAALLCLTALASAQLTDSIIDPNHPAIGYPGESTDRVAQLNRKLQSGEVRLEFDERTGYLRGLLAALDIPIESQVALFSGTSLQARIINARNPRTIFFNDSTAVGWMAGGLIEVASLDARQGANFYLLPQQTTPPLRQLARDTRCLLCHYSTATLGVPGFLVRSIPSSPNGMIMPWLGNYITDHRSPLIERWGGWYVTGRGGRHLGNAPIADRSLQDVRIDDANLNVATLDDRFDTRTYLSSHSDIVALLVFDHQMRMMNLLSRLGWETRILEHDRRPIPPALNDTVSEVVDYMLFVDEAALDGIRGTSGFAERFSTQGPRDGKGRSLRDFDLQRRLFRYPCSYMIYSDAFNALPEAARNAVYARLQHVLTGKDSSPKYAKLSAADRQAILEILRDTKKDLSFTDVDQDRPGHMPVIDHPIPNSTPPSTLPR